MIKNKAILMYHSIGSQSNGEVGAELYCVSEENFKKHMEYIKAGIVSPYITFDDGDITNYRYAYPALKELKISAYFFIIVAKIGVKGYMNWEQIRELRDAGMIIASHGMTHRILTELSDEDLDYELRASKKNLEDNLCLTIDYLSIPRGFYNMKVINKAKETGYKAIFSSNIEASDGFKFGRIPVKGNWDLEYFKKVLNNGFSLKDRAQGLIKNSSKKILGAKNYDRLRNIILTKD